MTVQDFYGSPTKIRLEVDRQAGNVDPVYNNVLCQTDVTETCATGLPKSRSR